MLFQLIILLAGLYYFIIKKPVVNSLKHENFPDVPKAGFDEWRTLENSRFNLFIVVSLGIFFASLTIGFVSRLLFSINTPGFLQHANLGLFSFFIILFFFSTSGKQG